MSRTVAGIGWVGPAALAISVHVAAALMPVDVGGAEESAPLVRLAIEPAPPVIEAPPEPAPEPPHEVPPPPIEPPPPARPAEPPPARVAEPSPSPEPTAEPTRPLGIDGALLADDSVPSELPPIEQALATPPPPPAPPVAEVDLSGYRDGLHRTLLEARRYPMLARRLGLEGEAQVRIRVRGDGSLGGEPELLRSTGHDVLDDEVIRLAKAVAPFPPLPDGYPDGEAEFLIPVAFQLGN
jgi:periplasmic protein TonB